jgi:hypothetical protein
MPPACAPGPLGYFVDIRAIASSSKGGDIACWKKRASTTLAIEGFSQDDAQEPALHGVRAQALSMPYAEAMGRLRQWLDRRKLQTNGFKITTDGRIGFEVCFSSEREAMEFQLFSWEQG